MKKITIFLLAIVFNMTACSSSSNQPTNSSNSPNSNQNSNSAVSKRYSFGIPECDKAVNDIQADLDKINNDPASGPEMKDRIINLELGKRLLLLNLKPGEKDDDFTKTLSEKDRVETAKRCKEEGDSTIQKFGLNSNFKDSDTVGPIDIKFSEKKIEIPKNSLRPGKLNILNLTNTGTKPLVLEFSRRTSAPGEVAGFETHLIEPNTSNTLTMLLAMDEYYVRVKEGEGSSYPGIFGIKIFVP